MLKIGDFSRLAQVFIKALRLYDQMGLLKPAQIDEWTGYRYYSASQLPRLNRILALKDLGLSLEQIATLLKEQPSPEELRGMLRLKQVELQQQIAAEQARLARVAARLTQIEKENAMSDYEVVLKTIAPLTVASIRDTLPNYPAIGQLFGELMGYLGTQQAKLGTYCAAIWHDPEYKESDVDGEAVFAIEGTVEGNDRVQVYELAGWEQAACVVHHGSYRTIPQAYNALLAWIEQNGYRVIGSNREFYIHGGNAQDDESYVTEIQFPVEKGTDG